ncbi:hypothetical protein BKH43_01885 [Helicobacter sp. 13S00401-1]|uniref:glycosyltransferase family 10 domain-containing protein n=1 Tax=Helicobacter sp. 13S00401-1 TaxID=1905758 RepID=UPI000BDDDA61|nr:glycosyltransferase family 10 [Helicobacter sp. 13S00401-1]PAF51414.1 hypothetical protein BKH43_01885 [Helicobacter sp. 13S00401-1]
MNFYEVFESKLGLKGDIPSQSKALKRELRVAFVDFWETFDKERNLIAHALRYNYELVYDESNPEVVFCSVFGSRALEYKCKRVIYIGENICPNFNAYDYALSFEHLSYMDRHLRMPHYIWQGFEDLSRNKYSTLRLRDDKTMLNRKFCNIVFSNDFNMESMRLDTLRGFSQYKQVDSGGRAANNIGGPVKDKIAFQSEYKFSLAIENSSHKGYVTEKIMDAFLAGSVPVYWGASDARLDFNQESFINLNDFANLESALEYIKKLDSDDSLYLKMLRSSPLNNGKFEGDFDIEKLASFLKHLIEEGEIYHKDKHFGRDANSNYLGIPKLAKYGTFFIINKAKRREARYRLAQKIIKRRNKQG